jgi:23S rRNA (guanosine2251-2'-O)-methyltransferase
MKNTVTHVVYGIHPIIELLKAKKRKVFKIYTTKPEPKMFKYIQQMLAKQPAEIVYKTKQELNQLAGTIDHQGIIALASSFQLRNKPFDSARHKYIVLLDSIQDPRNLGAIIRSAYCAGFQGIIIPKKGSAPINAVTAKASAGLIEHIEVYQAPSTHAAVQELIKSKYNLYISALTKQAVDATTVSYNTPLCLVIGSEGSGVNKNIFDKGSVVIIPQRTFDISYNASVAAGILMFIVANEHNLCKKTKQNTL